MSKKTKIIEFGVLLLALISVNTLALTKSQYLDCITNKVKQAHLQKRPICANTNDLLCVISKHYQPLYHANHLADYQQQIWNYSHKPAVMENILLNSKTYLYYLYQQTRKYHVPAQLVFVPAAESNYQGGTSRTGAAGLWQFMPSTAKGFGIIIQPGYDGRDNVLKATEAGIRYLKHLHDHFGSWLLAFAAYNCGEGRVERDIAINKSRGLPTDFWHLPLPHETQVYVRNILAISTILHKPNAYGIKLPNIPNKPYFSKIKIKQSITPNNAGYLSGISFNKIKKLNPAIKDWQNALSTNYNLLVPKAEKSQAVARLSAVDAVVAA